MVQRERVFRYERGATNAPLRVNDCQFALEFESANLRKNRGPPRRRSVLRMHHRTHKQKSDSIVMAALWRHPKAIIAHRENCMSTTSRTAAREHAHELIDRLPPAQLAAVASLLEAMLDPVAQAIASLPIEEEEITPETAADLDRASIERGEGIPHEAILREFGLTRRP